jgi:predicted RNA-binding Zn ribbon-like protein
MVMTTPIPESRAKTLALVGGVLALDFANTASGRGTDQPLDHLARVEDLFDWARHAGVALPPVTGPRPDKTALPVGQVLQLREAIYRIGAGLAAGQEPQVPDLALLRETATGAMQSAELARRPDGQFDWQPGKDATPLTTITGSIALSAVALLRDTDFTRLKQCQGPYCGWLFLDRSKNNSRRWCLMSVCGNRTKARRFQGRAG